MNKIYCSKKDRWIVVIHVMIISVCIWASFSILTRDSNILISLVVVLLLAGIGVVLPFWILIGTYYQINNGNLIIKSGPLKWQITIESIKSITPTRDKISSPALSFDRLRIDYDKYRSVLISPKDKDNFLLDIKQYDKHAA